MAPVSLALKVNLLLFTVQFTPDNSNPRQLEPRADSSQSRFPLDFLHTFTVILPSVTRSNFCFPSDYFYTILPSITRTVF